MENSKLLLSNVNVPEMSPEQILETANEEGQTVQLPLPPKPSQQDLVQNQTQDRQVIKESPKETQLLQDQTGARTAQMRAVMQGSSAPQMQMGLEQQFQSQGLPGRSVMQALPVPRMHPTSGNLSNLNQPADRSPGTELSPNLYDPGQPGPLLHYSPRDRMRLKYNIVLDPQRPLTGPDIAEMTEENVDILAKFDFDSFLNEDNAK